MVLTEPDAGSDVGAGRTKAVQQPDGTWHITGVKRFITSAEHDLTDNVVHLVLARPEGAGPGTKGLSLFVVPKFHVDLETGALGERNGAYVTNVEHKMGLKVSTTCEVRFGEVDGVPAVGTLVGDVHDGIAQMFKIIEYARMMVGTKAIATLSAGYLNALDYAKERVQGADLTQMTDKAAPRVTITHHPDVRRSLMLQKAYAEGMRALVLYTASPAGHRRRRRPAHGRRTSSRARPRTWRSGSTTCCCRSSRASAPSRRGCCSAPRACRPSAARASCRTTRSSSTSATPRSTPSTRAPRRSRARTSSSARSSATRARRWVTSSSQIQEFVKGDNGSGELATERELLGRALDDVQGIVGYMVGQLMASDPRGGAQTDVAQPLQGRAEHHPAAAGHRRPGRRLAAAAPGRGGPRARSPTTRCRAKDRTFYQGKVAAARFFVRNQLPRLTAERAIAEATDNALMDLDEAAF